MFGKEGLVEGFVPETRSRSAGVEVEVVSWNITRLD